MNRRNILSLSATTALGLALLPGSAIAQQKSLKSRIIGLWKLTSHANKIVATGALVQPYGEHPNGLQLFSRSGQMMFSMFDINRKAAAAPVPTGAEKAALFDSALAQIGTYRVDGNKIAIHYDATVAQSDVSTNRTYTAELSGNKLTLTALPFTSGTTGQQIISIRTFDRVE